METDPNHAQRSDGQPMDDGADPACPDPATIARFERLRAGDADPDAADSLVGTSVDPLAACLASIGNSSCPLESIERARPLADESAREKLEHQMRDDARKLIDSIALLVIAVALAAIGAIFRDRWGVLLVMAGILGGLVLLRAIVNAFRRRLIHRLCGSGRADDALERLERLNMYEAVVVAGAHAAMAVGCGVLVAERWMEGNTIRAIAFAIILGLPFLARTIASIRAATRAVCHRAPIVGGAR